MEVQDGIKFLINKYSSYDWYDSVGLDKYGRYVVYVTTMNREIMETVSPSLEGKQVLMHYASSKPENCKKHFTEIDLNRKSFLKESPKYDPFARDPKPVEISMSDLPKFVEEMDSMDLDELIAELDRLEKICGAHGLQDIFYEIHDGKNALTNLGSKYPEVKKDMSKLYDQYGFDLIYEELDN